MRLPLLPAAAADNKKSPSAGTVRTFVNERRLPVRNGSIEYTFEFYLWLATNDWLRSDLRLHPCAAALAFAASPLATPLSIDLLVHLCCIVAVQSAKSDIPPYELAIGRNAPILFAMLPSTHTSWIFYNIDCIWLSCLFNCVNQMIMKLRRAFICFPLTVNWATYYTS